MLKVFAVFGKHVAICDDSLDALLNMLQNHTCDVYRCLAHHKGLFSQWPALSSGLNWACMCFMRLVSAQRSSPEMMPLRPPPSRESKALLRSLRGLCVVPTSRSAFFMILQLSLGWMCSLGWLETSGLALISQIREQQRCKLTRGFSLRGKAATRDLLTDQAHTDIASS